MHAPTHTILIVGQVMALLLSGSGVFSQLLQFKYNVTDIAATQTFPNCILLTIIWSCTGSQG